MSRWLEWEPSEEKFEISPESEPSKPSKPPKTTFRKISFEGFNGSIHRRIQNSSEAQPALRAVEDWPSVEAWLEVQEREAEPEPACCRVCHRSLFWASVHGAVVCGVCHSPASPSLVERWLATPACS